jgi:hypothetical protein
MTKEIETKLRTNCRVDEITCNYKDDSVNHDCDNWKLLNTKCFTTTIGKHVNQTYSCFADHFNTVKEENCKYLVDCDKDYSNIWFRDRIKCELDVLQKITGCFSEKIVFNILSYLSFVLFFVYLY